MRARLVVSMVFQNAYYFKRKTPVMVTMLEDRVTQQQNLSSPEQLRRVDPVARLWTLAVLAALKKALPSDTRAFGLAELLLRCVSPIAGSQVQL